MTVRGARYPSLFQINTRVWLTELARRLGRAVTLDDIPEQELDRLDSRGFDWIWLLSVWQTGAAGRRVSRTNQDWQAEFRHTLPDLREEDVAGSGFAITGYTVHPLLGGDAALARLRTRLLQRGLRLMLDFVPNHTALDHPWVESHPEYFIAGTEEDLRREPQNYTRITTADGGHRVFAYGRDPYFSGWPDTLQLDYSARATQRAMAAELAKIAGQCDGVRCDMAMLVLPDVFQRTWGRRPEPFWSRVIPEVREQVPGFCFMAEVYWDLEWTMQHEGFDYAYDKRLYDRLREKHARPVRDHFRAGLDYQDRLARFLENHDEPRAAATFDRDVREAAAIVSFLSPGLRFFHQGQFEGRLKRISPHLVRAPHEPEDDSRAAILRAAPERARASGGSPRSVAAARVRAGVGRQRNVGRLPCLRVAAHRSRAPAGDGELCRHPGPVLCGTAFGRPDRTHGPVRRSDERGSLRSRSRRSRVKRAVSGHAAVGLPRVRSDPSHES